MTAIAAAPRREHRYRPWGSALELFRSRAPEVLLSGPAGTGKSRAALEKLHALMLKNPGARGLMVRKTAVSLTSSGLVTFREHVAKEAIESGEVKFYGGSPQEAASYRYGNGSTITIGGLDKATRIMSTEYDAIYVQEATELTEDDWEALTTRLRHGVISFQQLLADCNPDAPHHWLRQRCERGTTHLIYCRHEDNPRLYDAHTGTWTPPGAEYLRRLEALTGVRYDRLRLGNWVAAEGLIYDTFDPAVHLHPPIGLPPLDWPRYWVIDFGFNNPFVCQFWAEDPDGRLYLYRELYRTGEIVADHAKQILAIVKKGDGHKSDVVARVIITDHDAEGRATLERELGRGTTAAKKDVLEGIEAVKVRLKVAGDGKPRLFLCRDALAGRDQSLADAKKPLCTTDEILEYVWDDKAKKEQPLKRGDHGMDCMRYLVAQIDLVGRPRVRFFSMR